MKNVINIFGIASVLFLLASCAGNAEELKNADQKKVEEAMKGMVETYQAEAIAKCDSMATVAATEKVESMRQAAKSGGKKTQSTKTTTTAPVKEDPKPTKLDVGQSGSKSSNDGRLDVGQSGKESSNKKRLDIGQKKK